MRAIRPRNFQKSSSSLPAYKLDDRIQDRRLQGSVLHRRFSRLGRCRETRGKTVSLESPRPHDFNFNQRPISSPKVDCLTHGPSQVPLLDSELQRPQAKDIIHTLAKALNDIADEKKCTKCTAENISTLITGHVRDLRAAKRSGMWSKEDKKALKVEIKGLLKPAKKDIKSLWKANY
jgi:hypothetical protein